MAKMRMTPVCSRPSTFRENANALVGAGNGEDLTAEDRNKVDRLDIWTRMLQREDVLSQVVASYEAVPLLAEYAPRVNPQQIKNALIFREETVRVEKIIAESRLSCDRLFAAIGRVASCRGSERSRFAARLLHDLFVITAICADWKRSTPVLTASTWSATTKFANFCA